MNETYRLMQGMELHEQARIDFDEETGVWVTRVPGGWVYEFEAGPVFIVEPNVPPK